MTRRRVLLLGSVAVVAALALAAWLTWPRPGVTWANAAKIREGITRAEVEGILGGTPEQHAPPDETVIARPVDGGTRVIDGEQWWGSDVLVIVGFDGADKVSKAQRCEVFGPGRGSTFLRRIRNWLGL